jgi:hypothetical protein
LIWERKLEATYAFKIQEDFPGVEVGVLITKKGPVSFVGFGGNGDFPVRVEVVI